MKSSRKYSPRWWGCSVVLESEGVDEKTYSPRWWGCSAYALKVFYCDYSIPHAGGGVPLLEIGNRVNQSVFPTLVGVFRSLDDFFRSVGRYSPRWWGCSDHGTCSIETNRVFPTLVGVFRPNRCIGLVERSVFPTLVGVFRG